MATSLVTEDQDQSRTVENSTNLRCRKCRRCLIDTTSLLKVVTSTEAAATCNVWHLNIEFLPDWILASVDQASWTIGKLNCQVCRARLGGFNFINSSKCTCGLDTTVHLSKSRVDQDFKAPVMLTRPGRTREHDVGRRNNDAESQTISSSPSTSSTFSFSCTVPHVVSAAEMEFESSREQQIPNTVERHTDLPLLYELPPQVSDYQERIEEQHADFDSRTSLDGAVDQEVVRLGVMEEPLRNVSPNLEPKLSKREKNRLKSLRRKQRKKERWVQRQQHTTPLPTPNTQAKNDGTDGIVWISSASAEDRRPLLLYWLFGLVNMQTGSQSEQWGFTLSLPLTTPIKTECFDEGQNLHPN